MDTQMLIGAKFEAGTETDEKILNPKTGELIVDLPEASLAQVEAAVDAAEGAFVSWSQTTPGQRAGFIRLGVLGDWDHPYLTMDYRFEADIIRELGKIQADQGTDYRYRATAPRKAICGRRDRKCPRDDAGCVLAGAAQIICRLGKGARRSSARFCASWHLDWWRP